MSYKKDFPHSTPHITLYDGKNEDYAKALYEICKNYTWNIKTAATDLVVIEEKLPPNEFTTTIKFRLFRELFLFFINRQFSPDALSSYSCKDKIDIIDRILNYVVSKYS